MLVDSWRTVGGQAADTATNVCAFTCGRGGGTLGTSAAAENEARARQRHLLVPVRRPENAVFRRSLCSRRRSRERRGSTFVVEEFKRISPLVLRNSSDRPFFRAGSTIIGLEIGLLWHLDSL